MSGKVRGPGGGVAAVERALAILAAFDEHAPILTLAELAARTGFYKSTILRLLASLERGGFVERGRDGRYAIAAQAWRVGSLFTRDLTLGKVLLPIMEPLSLQARESVSFYILLPGTNPPMRMCLLRVAAPRAVRDIFYIGNRLPLDRGAGGRIIRAFTEPFYREDRFIREERAYAAWAELDPEVCAVGAPVMGPNGQFLGALLMSAPCARHDRDWLQAMKPVVIAAADQATQTLKSLRAVAFSEIVQAPPPGLALHHVASAGVQAKGVAE